MIALGAIWTITRTNANPIVSTTLVDTDSQENTISDEMLFEGDIKISKQVVIDRYNFSSIPGGKEFLNELKRNISTENYTSVSQREKRGAGRSVGLWTNSIVRYRISSSISQSAADLIREAMDHWEDNTCLRFLSVSQGGNYIEFVNSDTGCYSSIGMRGGRQVINLKSPGCNNFGIIVHEIGHAVGFWHEQSRPDRDDYVTINFDNIIDSAQARSNFMKRSDDEINSLGSVYDYGSIMHYPRNAFDRDGCVGNGCETITVNNNASYLLQGSPTLGQRTALSNEDISQANILYICPGTGERGFLLFRARYGRSLRDTDFLSNPDPYIKFTAVDSSGYQYTRTSSVKSGTRNPSWNEWVPVSDRDWYFFRMQVWDDDNFLAGADDKMTLSETFLVESGQHFSLKHCENTACNGYVIFDYRLLSLSRGKLQFYIRYARSLRDTDPIWNDPDPYVRVKARYSTGGVSTATTRDIGGTTNPTWNQWLNFGCRKYAYFEIQVWDEDSGFTGSDDAMSNSELVFVQPGNHYSQRHNAHGSGYLIYNYNFILDGNECISSPCQNGGTCVDLCASYHCNCRSGYIGTNCEHRTGRLRVYARYARNLPDEDGWWNNSDPYMEFIAVDQNGNSVRLRTATRSGTQNPNWNQALDFGTRSWRYLKVRVYDQDSGSDDALSNRQTITLSNPGISRTNFYHYCHSGYAVFDYSYN